jgi:hypothetical protein
MNLEEIFAIPRAFWEVFQSYLSRGGEKCSYY